MLTALVLAPAMAQPVLIDHIVAVVGARPVLRSEIIARVEQSGAAGEAAECGELEDLLYEKLLLEQGRLDSVVVEEAQVNAELDRRIRYFAAQLGGEKKLEEFYGKSVAEIRAEFREQVHDQLLVQQMQQRVTADVRVTPRDVEQFYRAIPADSVPFINSEVQYAQLLRVPQPSEEEDRRVRRRLDDYRRSVIDGERDFCTVAILYSEDPGSAKDCGDLGMVPTGVMVPEFDAVALSLKEGEISQVFKTRYGYHFMQLVERRGEQYHARHMLMRPKVSNEDLRTQQLFLDSLRGRIVEQGADFGAMAATHSDDEESRDANGIMIDPATNSLRWDMSALDQQTFFVLDKLKPGEVSEPQLVVMPDGTKAWRLVRLIERTEPHKADLATDYHLIQQAAEGKLRAQAVDRWVKERLETTYVRLDPGFAACPFLHQWGRAGTDARR